MLLALLLFGLICFAEHIEKKNRRAVIIFGILTGVSFYVKGVAAFMFFPAYRIFLIGRKKLFETIKSQEVFISFARGRANITSWDLINSFWIEPYTSKHYGDKSATETKLRTNCMIRFFVKLLDY